MRCTRRPKLCRRAKTLRLAARLMALCDSFLYVTRVSCEGPSNLTTTGHLRTQNTGASRKASQTSSSDLDHSKVIVAGLAT
jgi:hypothetical protein